MPSPKNWPPVTSGASASQQSRVIAGGTRRDANSGLGIELRPALRHRRPHGWGHGRCAGVDFCGLLDLARHLRPVRTSRRPHHRSCRRARRPRRVELDFRCRALAAGLCPLHWRESSRPRIRRPREDVRCRTRINGDQIWETAMVDRALVDRALASRMTLGKNVRSWSKQKDKRPARTGR